MKCIEFERLIDYADGRISGAEAASIKSHVAACSLCSVTDQWYLEFRGLGKTLSLAEPPAWVIKRAERLFNLRNTSPDKRIARAASAVAKLVFDSFSQVVPQGARSAQIAQRQLVYSVDNYSIDLQITKSELARTALEGQVIDASEADFNNVSNVPVKLVGPAGSISSTATNDIGEFMIAGVHTGEYTLSIDTRDMTITIILPGV